MMKAVRVLIATFALVLFASAAFAQKAGHRHRGTSPPSRRKVNSSPRSSSARKAASSSPSARAPQGERPYDSIALEGSKITMVITISYNGSPMVITYNGTDRQGPRWKARPITAGWPPARGPRLHKSSKDVQ